MLIRVKEEDGGWGACESAPHPTPPNSGSVSVYVEKMKVAAGSGDSVGHQSD